MSPAELWARLAADGLVEGGLPEEKRAQGPWFVRVMLGIAGWIGALFLLGFVGIGFVFIFENSSFALLAGAAFCTGGYSLLRTLRDNDFAEQFGLALSLVGQLLIAFGLGGLAGGQQSAGFLAVAVVQAALAYAVPHFLHRVLATTGAGIALAIGLSAVPLPGFAAPFLCAGLAWIWLDSRRWAGRGALWRPIGYGLVVALLLVEGYHLLAFDRLFGSSAQDPRWIALHGPLLARIAGAAVLAWVVLALTRQEKLRHGSRAESGAFGAAAAAVLAAVAMPGLASASIVLMLGFAAKSRILMALGVLGLLGFVAHFYYSLHATLLVKSGILAATGIVLLLAYLAIVRGVFSARAEGEAGNA